MMSVKDVVEAVKLPTLDPPSPSNFSFVVEPKELISLVSHLVSEELANALLQVHFEARRKDYDIRRDLCSIIECQTCGCVLLGGESSLHLDLEQNVSNVPRLPRDS